MLLSKQSGCILGARTAYAQRMLAIGSSKAGPGRQAARRPYVCVKALQGAAALPGSLQKIVGAFQMVPDPMARYKQLLFYATKLEPLPAADHQPENKVEGCVSQVWVKPELRDDGKIYWRADSDSQLTKGLAALLVLGLSGCTPAEILSVQPTFIELLGLKQSLTPSRNNGFLNMFLKMQKLTLVIVAGQGAQQQQGEQQAAATQQQQQQQSVEVGR